MFFLIRNIAFLKKKSVITTPSLKPLRQSAPQSCINNIANIGKMAGAWLCVLRQYTIHVNKLIDFDRQISDGYLCQCGITFLFVTVF